MRAVLGIGLLIALFGGYRLISALMIKFATKATDRVSDRKEKRRRETLFDPDR